MAYMERLGLHWTHTRVGVVNGHPFRGFKNQHPDRRVLQEVESCLSLLDLPKVTFALPGPEVTVLTP